MEDFRLDVLIDEGPAARAMKIALPRFTLVGATTRTGLLTSPLRDRFPHSGAAGVLLAPSSEIVDSSAQILGVPLDPSMARPEIARRARGTPRIANRLLRRVRDFAEVEGDGVVTRSWPTRRLSGCRLTLRAWTPWTAGSCSPSSRSSGWPGGRRDHRGQRGRGARHRRGRLRALPDAGGVPSPDAQGSDG